MASFGQDSLKVAAPSAAIRPIEEAAHILLAERDIHVDVSPEEGSSSCVQALGEGRARVAVVTRSVTAEDRSSYPEINFSEIPFGKQAVALVVSRDVWEGGVRALTRAQVRAIYERQIRSWDELGGPKTKIEFFNFEEGHGEWEIFALWLYGDLKKASSGRFQEVKSDQEARDCVALGTGAMAQIAATFPDGKTLFALSIKGEDGKLVGPSNGNIASGNYPLAHPLLLVVDDKPTMAAKTFVDFVTGLRGQELVKKSGFLTLQDLQLPKSR